MFYDVIVIGAGLAGLMAAEAAQIKGARVLVLARGLGSLPLTSGCIDGLGYLPTSTNNFLPSPLNALDKLREGFPHHPYVKVGREKILSSLAHFQELASLGGIPYCGSFESTLLLPTPLGTFHPTCLAPETMKDGSLNIPGPVLLLGFEGLKDFSPFLAAENLNILRARGAVASSFRAETLSRLDLGGKALNAVNLARAFDVEDFRNQFSRKVKPLLKKGERLGLPAILGFHSSFEDWADLKKKLDSEIFELPLPPPSVPGLRLYNLLRNHLRDKGVRIIIGLSALNPLIDGKKLIGFALGGSKQGPFYKAPAFVLATGKFVGGGLDSDRGKIYETLLDLPVNHPKNRGEWFNPRILAATGQPFNRFGVEVDQNLQPVDHQGQVIYSNLFAAGGIIAQADSMSEKSGGGVAIATGYVAGTLAASVIDQKTINHSGAE